MIAQRTSWHIFPALPNSAKASVRLLSSVYRFLTHSHIKAARQLSSRVNSNATLSSDVHHHGDACSAPCHGYNPHRQPLLLLPTL